MIFSFSLFFIHLFPLPHHLAGSAKANQIEVVSCWLDRLEEARSSSALRVQMPLSALYGRQFSFQSIATAILQN
jgi:hypothetical protein